SVPTATRLSIMVRKSTCTMWCASTTEVRTTSRISGWCIRTATVRFTASVRLLGYVDCLSRVPGDWYARFCGEGVIAISSPYPTSYRQTQVVSDDVRLRQPEFRE